MDPATARMALQLAATLGRSRGVRYLVVGLVLTSVLAGLAVVFGPWMLTAEISASLRSQQQQQSAIGGSCSAPNGNAGAAASSFTAEQVANARTIWSVAQQMSMGSRGALVGIATALQESGLRNLPYGDLDSLGLFQQRANWGSRAVRMDPVKSSQLFFGALTKIKNWQQMPVALAAQSVQQSAFPDAYNKQQGPAANLMALIQSRTGPGSADAQFIGTAVCGTGDTASGPVVLPVDHYVLTARFGQCSFHWANCHTGLDFAAPQGTPIHAVTSGTVVWTGWGGPYGNLTKLQNAGGVQTWYAHQSAIVVKPGETVAAGQTIGRIGATGNATGPHVHLEVRINGLPVDPAQWLTAHGVAP